MAEYICKDKVINDIKSLISSMPAKDNYAKGYDAALGRALIAVREVLPAADVKILKCEKWKEILEILRDAVEELEYYETHGDLLDRHIWKYKNEALALIGKDGEDNESK